MRIALVVLLAVSAMITAFGFWPVAFGLLLAFGCAHLMLRWVVLIPLLFVLSMPAAGRAEDLEDLPACQDYECDFA